jgi:chemotaxis protein methyltransferase CheR
MDIDRLSRLIEQSTGLSVRTRLRADLEAMLLDLARGDLANLYLTLQHTPLTDPTWQAVVQALTIGETYFFRDSTSFNLLRTEVLPSLIRQRRAARRQELSVWCAGCATGEEPYSVAMLLYELLPDLDQWNLNIIGTDINARALQHARRGVYREWAFRQNAPDLRSRYFKAVTGGWRLQPRLRNLVMFRQANLLHEPPLSQVDLIFCRNVLIYLTRAHIARLESTLLGTLVPGGWLLLGASEALHTRREQWETHIYPGAVLYQKAQRTLATPITHQHQTKPLPEPPAPNGGPPTDRYAAALQAVRNKQPADAEYLLAELLAHEPGNAQAHVLLAAVFANRQAVPEAQAHIAAALTASPMLSNAYFLRGILHLEANRPAEAEKALRAALYCQRDNALAAFMLGTIQARSGDAARASRTWSTAREIVRTLPPESHISDLSDLTASAFDTLIETQLTNLTPDN